MSDAISKVLFIGPSTFGGEPRDYVGSRYGNQWKVVGSRVNADGVSEVSIARPYETFSPKPFVGKRFVEFGDAYRQWLANLEVNLSGTMEENFLRPGEIDAVVVRSGEVMDIRAAVTANGLLQVGGNRPVPLILQVGDTLLGTLRRDATLDGLRTYTSHGDSRYYPSNVTNVSLSPEVVELLTDPCHERAIGPEELEFIRSLQRPTNVGDLPMLAEVMPYVGIFLFNPKGNFTWFKRLVDVAPNMMPSVVVKFHPAASSAVIAKAESSALKRALLQATRSDVKVADARHLDQSRNHAGIMRFSPGAVARELKRLSIENPDYESYGSELRGLVYKDLAGLKTAQEINEAARSLLERGRVEVRR